MCDNLKRIQSKSGKLPSDILYFTPKKEIVSPPLSLQFLTEFNESQQRLLEQIVREKLWFRTGKRQLASDTSFHVRFKAQKVMEWHQHQIETIILRTPLRKVSACASHMLTSCTIRPATKIRVRTQPEIGSSSEIRFLFHGLENIPLVHQPFSAFLNKGPQLTQKCLSLVTERPIRNDPSLLTWTWMNFRTNRKRALELESTILRDSLVLNPFERKAQCHQKNK